MKTAMMILCIGSLLAACNTIEGAGQDINKAGQAISSTAKKTKDKMD